jgi:hypothetical protein
MSSPILELRDVVGEKEVREKIFIVLTENDLIGE